MITADEIAVLAGSENRLELWTSVINRTGAQTVAEIGVWKGDFAAHILRECPSVQTYYMIDPWASLPDWNKPANVSPERFDSIFDEAMGKTAFAAKKVHVLRGRTIDVANEIPDGSLDFAYVDGDHTLRGITIDLMNILPKMRTGGLLTGDDFTRTPWQHDARFEPTLVCPWAIYFAEANRLPITAFPNNQFMITNTHDAGFSFTDTAGKYGDLSLNRLHRKSDAPGAGEFSPMPITARAVRVARRAAGSVRRSLVKRRMTDQ